jgi:hypothetical protein
LAAAAETSPLKLQPLFLRFPVGSLLREMFEKGFQNVLAAAARSGNWHGSRRRRKARNSIHQLSSSCCFAFARPPAQSLGQLINLNFRPAARVARYALGTFTLLDTFDGIFILPTT